MSALTIAGGATTASVPSAFRTAMTAVSPYAMAFGAIATIGGMFTQYKNTKKANKANEEAAAENLKARLLAARNARVQAVKERQAVLAQLNATAAATGTTGSSGAVGAVSSVASQFGQNQGLVQAMQMYGAGEASASNRAQKNLGVAQEGQNLFQLGQITSSMFSKY